MKALAMLRLCRPYYGVPMALTYLLTVYYAAGGEMTGAWAGALVSTLALLLVIAGGYVLNDVCDAEVDRVNAPARPIPSGRVGRKAAGVLAAALLAGGLGAAAACRWQYLAALSAVAGGLVAYDILSKRIGPAKQVVVAVLMTSIYPLALAQAGGPTGPRAWALAAFPAWLLPTAFGYELLKDLRDAAGDRRAAPRQTRVQRRPLLMRRVAAAVIVAAAPLLLLPGWLGCKWVYLIGASCAIVLAAASAFAPVRRAIRLIYFECLLAALAAAADALILGM